MQLTLHMDEARSNATARLEALVSGEPRIERVVLIDDLFGRIRLILWPAAGDVSDLVSAWQQELRVAAGPYWTGDIWLASPAGDADTLVYDSAWNESISVGGSEQLRRLDRHRSKGGWFQPVQDPPWPPMPADTSGTPPERRPPVLVFYSFKGGVGRTTALASFAIQRARRGERVVVIDFDLDAPGVGALLAADEKGTTAPWGVTDYLLERPHGEVNLSHYYHTCARDAVTGTGSIVVLPAGRMNDDYLNKLARLDLEPAPQGVSDPLRLLLDDVREQLAPDWILLDARAGLSGQAGLLMAGLAHLYVLFGTLSEQSWQGLGLVLDRLGRDRILHNQPQSECLLIQAMTPAALSDTAKRRFAERARVEFERHYYAEAASDPSRDRFWSILDMESREAPHVPVHVLYDARFAVFSSIDEIAGSLATMPEYVELSARIENRFERVPA